MATIWMYHRVLSPRPTAFGLPGCYHLRGTAISPEVWKADLERLRPVIPLAAVVEAVEAGCAPPVGHVLTFDDGYAEWTELVAPSLRAAGATATFFITSGMRRDGLPRPIDAYYWLLDHAVVRDWEVTLPDGQRVRAELRTAEDKRVLVTESPIKQALLRGDEAVQAAVLAEVAKGAGATLPDGVAASLYMDEAQWRELARGHTIGAHGVTHRPWTLLDEATLRCELHSGRAALTAATGAVVEFAAYPDGACDARVVAATRAAGYRAAMLAENTANREVFGLPRVFRC